MVDFPSAVAVPSTASYAAPQVDFSWLSRLPQLYRQAQLDQQQKQLNDLKLQQEQQQSNLSRAFSGGLPMKNGAIDYAQVANTLARLGDINAVTQLYPAIEGQQAGKIDPMLAGIMSPAQPTGDVPPASAASAQPTSPTPVGTSKGDPGTGTIVDLVAAKYGDNDVRTGQLSARIASVMDIDPNATLTPGQQRRASGLLQRYSVGTAATVQPAFGSPAARVADAFSALPATAAMQPATAGQPAPINQPTQSLSSTPLTAAASPAAPSAASTAQPAAPATQPLGPIGPQVPLPKGYGDPEQAILALRARAAALSANPRLAGQASALNKWAEEIEKSIKPREVHAGETLLDPQTGRLIYQAPRMSLFGRSGTPEMAQQIADGIKDGTQPPTLTGLYGMSGPIRAQLQQDGFDLAKAQIEWTRAQRQIATLNGAQMTRFAGLASSVNNTIDEVRDLAQQMQLSGVPLFNKAQITAYMQTSGNTAAGKLATRYVAAINTLKEEFANLAQGGYAPTDSVWALANKQINGDYGVDQLDASLTEIKRLLNYRIQGIPGLSTLGGAAANRYTGSPPAPASQGWRTPVPPTAPGRTERPTITNPTTGEKRMLSPDGKSWVPYNSL